MAEEIQPFTNPGLADLVIQAMLATRSLNPDDAVALAEQHEIPLWVVADRIELNRKRAPWTQRDDKLLRDKLGLVPFEEVIFMLNRPAGEIDERAFRLKLPYQKLIAGRKTYSVWLAARLLGVRGRDIAGWGTRGYLHIYTENKTRVVSRADLYRLLSLQDVAERIDPDSIIDLTLRRVYLDRRANPTRRPAQFPERRFTDEEDTWLGWGCMLGLDLMADWLERPEREIKARLSLLDLADYVPEVALAQGEDMALLSWKQGGLRPLVEAIVRYDARRATLEDCRWVGRLFLLWLEFYGIAYPACLCCLLDSGRALKAVEVMHRLLLAAGLDPLHEQPPEHASANTLLPKPLRDTYTWAGEEITFVRRHWGLLKPAVIAAECTAVLQRLSGDRTACRTEAALLNLVGRLNLDGRTHWSVGLLVFDASRWSGINHYTVWDAVEAGEMTVIGTGKYRYIPWSDWFAWRAKRFAYRAKIAAVLASINEETISKQEAMALIGICETHITRYLQGGIIRAWKLPIGDRGEWRVSRADALRVKEERDSGKLVLETPEYEAIRQKSAQVLKDLRARGRSWESRDKSSWLPGYLTPHGLAAAAGVGIDRVRDDIRAGVLPAQTRTRGRRTYYAVAPADAAAYTAQMQGMTSAERRGATARRKRENLRVQGFLTISDVAEQLNVSKPAVTKWARLGILRSQRTGRLLVFKPEDIAAYRGAMGNADLRELAEQRTLEAIRQQGLLPVEDVAVRLAASKEAVRRLARSGVLPSQRRGGRHVFRPDDVAAFKRARQVGGRTRLEAVVERRIAAIHAQGLLIVEEVAAQLGVSSSTVTKQAGLGAISSQRIGRRLAFRPEDVTAYQASKEALAQKNSVQRRIDAIHAQGFLTQEDVMNELEIPG